MSAAHYPHLPTEAKIKADWVQIIATESPVNISHFMHGKPSATWNYLNSEGHLLGLVCRFDTPNGKEVLPYTFRQHTESGKTAWMFKGFNTPRPLYNLPELKKRPSDPVLIVEGEKTADAAAQLFRNHVCICWQGGANGINVVDWLPLKGRCVALWPDNDQPGFDAMQNISRLIEGIASSVFVVKPPNDKAKGWDLADALTEGWTPQQANEFILANAKMLSMEKPTPPKGDTRPLQAKIKAERTLLGAMLRDCHLMPQVIAGLNVVALAQASNGMGAVFTEIIAQFQDKGKYTVTTIGRKVASKELLQIASEDTDVDLPMALDWWWLEYSKWAQGVALETGMQTRGDALAMREAVAKMEVELGLNWSPGVDTAPDEFEQWAMDKIEGKEILSNMRSPIHAMHEFIEYFEKGYVTAISGDTSMGKSQLAFQLFSSFCDQGAKGGFDTLEMPKIDPLKRILGIRHGINPKAKWKKEDFPRIIAAVREVKALPNKMLKLFSMGEIEAHIVAAKYNGGIDFFFVDLLKYVTMPMPKGVSREEALSTIVGHFIMIAGRHNVHIFLLHHLNGDLAKRGGSKRPQLDDLRDSKAIKQDVANVIFCYRPAYYGILEDENGKDIRIYDESGNVIGDRAELIIAKNRNGELGTAKVRWSPIRGYRDLNDQPKVGYTPPGNSENPDLPF